MAPEGSVLETLGEEDTACLQMVEWHEERGRDTERPGQWRMWGPSLRQLAS